MIRRLSLAVLVLGILCLSLYAQTIQLSQSRAATGFTITKDNIFTRQAPALNLKCHIASLHYQVVNTPQGKFTYLYIPGYQATPQTGAPQLPMMNRIIEIPHGAKVSAKVLKASETIYSYEDLKLTYPVFPRQPSYPKDGTKPAFVYNAAAYQVRGFIRPNLVSIEAIGRLRSRNLALLKVAPVQYDPSEKRLKVYNDIEIEISLEGADYALTSQIKARYASPAYNGVASRVLTPPSLQALNTRNNKRAPGFLIIADRMFQAQVDAYASWRASKGFAVTTAYTDDLGGATNENIHNYIAQQYNSSNPPVYVLFVGDHEQIPAYSGSATVSYHISDLYYTTMDGSSDYLPDMLYGRFSAQSVDQLTPQIEKTMMYVDASEPDGSFVSRVVLIAGWDSGHAKEWGWPQINYGTDNYFNAAHGYTTVSVYLSAGSHQNEQAIRDAIAAGCVFVNYTAHGSSTTWADPSFNISKINGLGNYGQYPLVIGNCCLTNKFEVGTCFGEGWLRADGQGAVGYIGGSNSTYWDEDLWWGNGFYAIAHPNDNGAAPNKADTGHGAYDEIFENGTSNAAVMQAGNMAVQESNSSRKRYYWEVYHLMGDPAVVMRRPGKK